MQEVPAGNVLALAGLDMAILKSATVASSALCRPLAPMLFQSAPIVRVAGGQVGCVGALMAWWGEEGAWGGRTGS